MKRTIIWLGLACFGAGLCAGPAEPTKEQNASGPQKGNVQPRPMAGGPMVFPVQAGVTGTVPHATQINAEEFTKLIEMIKESSAKIEKIQQSINARTQAIYDTHPEVKKLYAELVEKQKRINAIIEADPEYAETRMRRDVLATVIPDEPRFSFPTAPGQGGFPMMPSGGAFQMGPPPAGKGVMPAAATKPQQTKDQNK